MFRRREVIFFFSSVLLIAFVFGFDDGQKSIVLSHWIQNFLWMMVFAVLSLGIHELAQRWAAHHYNVVYTFDLWRWQRFGLKKKLPPGKGVPVGILFSLFWTFYSLGQFPFSAVTSYTLEEHPTSRAGRKFIHLTDFEEAKIAFSGIFANLLLFLFLVQFKTVNPLISTFAWMNLVLAASYFIPLPGLNGAKIFFGSRTFYIFTLSCIIGSFLFSGVGFLFSVVLLLVFAALDAFSYYIKREK